MIERLRHARLRWLGLAGLAGAAAAANVLLGYGAAVGERTLLLVVVVGMLPVALIAFGALVEVGSHRALLAWVALASNFVGIPVFTEALPVPGSTSIYLPDVLLLLAVGTWLAAQLSGSREHAPVRLSSVFGWPLLLLGVTIMGGVILGHDRYGTSIVGQPLRLVLFAGIALALTDTDVRSAWRAITAIFYAGAIVQSVWAVYYLVSGTSQTASVVLSTGGERILALSTAMYLTGSLTCALLNLDLERRQGRQFVHVLIAALALFGIIVSFGRTTYAAVVLIVPFLLITRRYLRRTMLLFIPLLVPALLIAALLVPKAAPDLFPTLTARLSGLTVSDSAVDWRTHARDATLEGVDEEWFRGVGFGRVVEFTFNAQVSRLEGADPHNSYVWLLAGGGVLALGALLVLCLTYVVDAVRRLRLADPLGRALVLWSLATWFVIMVNALTGPVLSEPRHVMTFWILIALPGLVLVRPRNDGTR